MRDSFQDSTKQIGSANFQESEAQKTQVTEIKTKLLETHREAEIIIQNLEELKKHLIPNLNQDINNISLESALASLPSEDQIERNLTEDNGDWEPINQTLSRLTIEKQSLLAKASEINKQISAIDSDLRNLNWDQENRRRNLKTERYSRKEPLHRKINKKIKSLFLGIREYGEEFSKRDLENKKDNFGEQLEEVNSQLEIIQNAIQTIDKHLSKEVSIYLEKHAEQLVEIWESHADKMSQEPWVNEEITQKMVEERILPLLERGEQEETFSKENKDKFLTDLSEFIEARNAGNIEEKNRLWTELCNSREVYNYVIHELQNLSDENDLTIVKNMVAHLAYEQLSKFKQDFLENLPEQIASELNRVLDEKLKFNVYYQAAWRPKSLLESKEIGVNLTAFSLLKKSETARAIYGPLIEELDDNIYQILMDKSLSDTEGSYIDYLILYPTPDAIKNLLIIAAADGRGYRVNHANKSLTILAMRDNWELILDQTIESFPELAQAKELLINWNYTEYANHSDIKKHVSGLAKQVLDNDSEDKRLRIMAQESLLNNAMITEMANKGLITQEDALSYQQSYEALFKLSQYNGADPESPEAEKAQNFSSHLYSWEYEVREVLKNLDKAGPESNRYTNLLNDFKGFLHLGELWTENQKDEEKLSFLSSYKVLNLATGKNEGPKASIEELTFIKDAYGLYPLLKGAKNQWIFDVFQHAPSYFLNESGMKFFQNFYNKHSDGKEEHSSQALSAILFKVGEGKLSRDNALNFYENIPPIIVDNLITSHHLNYEFVSDDGLLFLQKFHQTYLGSPHDPETLQALLIAVGQERISPERTLELHEQAADLIENKMAFKYPELFLSDNEAVIFARKFIETAQQHGIEDRVSDQIASHVNRNDIPPELSLDYIKILPHLFEKEQENIKNFILNHAKKIANDQEDLKFLSRFMGTHGKQTLGVLKEYIACVETGSVANENRDKILEFTKKFRTLSPIIVEGYLKAEAHQLEDAYIAELQEMTSQMIGSEPMSEQDRQKPYYQDLLRAVYANNSGNWGGYERTQACADRVGDLAEFTFDPKYEIDLLEAATIKIKDGEVINEAAIESLKMDILNLAEEMKNLDFDLEKIQLELNTRVDDLIKNKKVEGALEDIDLNQLENLDQKIFVLLADSIYGKEQASSDELKQLVLRYEFSFFDDIRDYIQGTTDRVSQAPNQDYALMCELHSFFADRIKEINRRLVKAGWENESLREIMPKYFTKVSQERSKKKLDDQANRFRLDRLGMSESFIQQISRTLEKRRGKKYPPETIRRLIRYYENLTQGLTVKTVSDKGLTKAFYGQLKAQRAKTMEAMETITGDKIDPQKFSLGDISLEDLAISLAKLNTGEYNEEQFRAFTTLRFLNLFADEKNLLETELDKFESESGQQRQVVNGFFTKTKESANARMVGGVCVSQDNPVAGRTPEQQRPNMWDSDNYFQFVLQDPETNRCLGLVLLHHFEENGEKVLAASLNPSSTFLYSTDEDSIFRGLMKSLENFAKTNGFDKILISQNKSIRTNRTGGKFEGAINKRQGQINKTFSFEEEKVFSYSPAYKIKDMDVVWER